MHLANPIWLWGLTGLLIPAAIHLLSRKEGRVIYIGSVRHLEESNTSQFRALKLNELWLLLLRCLILMLVVLLLAGPRFNVSRSTKSWVLIEKSVEHQPEVASLVDSLEERGYEKHYWQDGFPLESDSDLEVNNWNLIQELSWKNVNAVILAHSYFTQFRGERIALPTNIQWISVSSKPGQYVVAAHPLENDSLLLRVSNTNEQLTSLEYQRVPTLPSDSVSIAPLDTINIHVAYNEKYSREKEIVAAMVKSLQTIPSTAIQLSVQSDEIFPGKKTDWLVWLSEKQLPTSAMNLIQISAESKGDKILSASATPSAYQHWNLRIPLTTDDVLQENLVVTLASMLLNDGNHIPHDQRVLPEALLKSVDKKTEASTSLGFSTADSYLLGLILLLLLAERLLSYYRNQ